MKILKGEVLDVQGFSATIDEKTKTLTIGATLQNAEHSNYRIFINAKEKLAYADEKLIDWKKAFNQITNEFPMQMREVNAQLVKDENLSKPWREALDQAIEQDQLNLNLDETLLLKLYDKKEIPSKVLGHQLSEKQIGLLCRGEIVTLSGISLDGQEKRDIGIKMQTFLDENKEVKKGIMFSIKSKVLEIPDRILDHPLSPEEKQSLKQGEFVGVVKDEKNFLVSVNQKTNSVVVNVPAELGIKEELGGYKFDKEELAYLANGKELPTRLFKSEKHGYYTAELKILKEGNQVSYQFNNVASVSPAEAKKLVNELNNHLLPSENTASKVIDTVLGQEKRASLNEKDSAKVKTGGEVKKSLETLKTPARKTR